MFSVFVSEHPIFTLFLYICICAGVGIGIFFTYSAIRKKIEIRKNMKARVHRDKSC